MSVATLPEILRPFGSNNTVFDKKTMPCRAVQSTNLHTTVGPPLVIACSNSRTSLTTLPLLRFRSTPACRCNDNTRWQLCQPCSTSMYVSLQGKLPLCDHCKLVRGHWSSVMMPRRRTCKPSAYETRILHGAKRPSGT